MISKLIQFLSLITLLLFSCEKDVSLLGIKSQDSLHVELPSSKITFVSERDGNPEIYIMDIDGKNQTRLTNNDGMDYIPKISSDGIKIVYFSEKDGQGGIWIMNSDGTEQNKLLDLSEPWFFYPFFISGDGNTIVHYSYYHWMLSIVNSDGSNPEYIAGVEYYYEPVTLSKDGRKILFSCYIESSENYDIILMDLANRRKINLTPDSFPKYNYCASLSPDEDTIIYTTSDPSWENEYIYKLNIRDGKQIKITDDQIIMPYWPRYSTDGSKIIFTAEGRYGGYTSEHISRMNPVIYVMDRDGSNIKILSNRNAYSYEAVLSKLNMDIFYPAWTGIYKANLINLTENIICDLIGPRNLVLIDSYIYFETSGAIYRIGINGNDLENLTNLEENNYSFSIFQKE